MVFGFNKDIRICIYIRICIRICIRIRIKTTVIASLSALVT